jgi:ribosome-binding protein aMBF1 (putative translation factor)
MNCEICEATWETHGVPVRVYTDQDGDEAALCADCADAIGLLTAAVQVWP